MSSLRSHGHLEPDVEVMVTGGIGYLSSEKVSTVKQLSKILTSSTPPPKKKKSWPENAITL